MLANRQQTGRPLSGFAKFQRKLSTNGTEITQAVRALICGLRVACRVLLD
jgi:hypothetical protein